MSSRVAVEVTVEARPADVFAAWTDNDKLQQWFAEYADVSVDEGRFNFWGKHTVGNPSSEAANHELRDVQQGKSLAFGWRLHGRDTEVSVALQPHDRGTHIVVHHDGVAAWEAGQPALSDFWTAALENLRALLEGGAVALRPDFSGANGSTVELSTEIAAPAASVYQGLLDPEQLTRYFPDNADVDAAVGGAIDFHWGNGVGPRKILDLDPERKIAYSWDDHGRQDTVVTWELEESEGKTRLLLVHSGFAEEDPGYWMGWIAVLNALKTMLEGGDGWQRVRVVHNDVEI